MPEEANQSNCEYIDKLIEEHPALIKKEKSLMRRRLFKQIGRVLGFIVFTGCVLSAAIIGVLAICDVI